MFLLMVNDVNKYKNWSTKNIEAYRLAATCKKGHFDALLRDAFFPLGETIRLAWRLCFSDWVKHNALELCAPQ